MVQKSESKRRGRPPAYDAAAALTRALETFWHAGFAATSLDDLVAATGMNRPSLYGAFGDKRALYLKTLAHYRAGGKLREALAYDRPLAEALRRVYAAALQIYLSGDSGPRGCYLIGTAATEAVGDAEVRAALAEGLREIDEAFAARFRHARKEGEIDAAADPLALAKLASAILHTLALRARAGDSRASLEATAKAGVAMLCGTRRLGVSRRGTHNSEFTKHPEDVS